MPARLAGIRELGLGLAVFLAGLGFAAYLHWPALSIYPFFKQDVLQSPHWAAYHTSSFRDNDLVLLYAAFNESPLQNALYWLGTWFVESVRLGKILAVVSYGLLSLLFYVVGRAMSGVRFGLLLALFITFFPDQWEFSTGFFSKFWAIPVLLLCVFFLQTDRFRGLIWLLPFAAIAYPSVAVLVGMTASVYWIQEWHRRRGRAVRLFRCLAIGSTLAVALLLVKYASPHEAIGPMRAGAELRQMPEVADGGYPSHYIPVPALHTELISHVDHPFIVLCAVFYFLVLGRGFGWQSSWSALFFASAIGYLLADYFFLRLYVPDRYTRYSMAVLLALWNARNWDLILARVNLRAARYALVGGLLVVGGLLCVAPLNPGKGWSDRSAITPVCDFIRLALPDGILVAGSPKRLDDVMIQGKRSVLCPYRLAHPWFTTYYDEIRTRTRATLRAHFAAGPEPLNELHRRYGVTHFIVEKELFERVQRDRPLFVAPYSEELYSELDGRREFYLWPEPPQRYLWEDEEFAILELPIPEDSSL